MVDLALLITEYFAIIRHAIRTPPTKAETAIKGNKFFLI